jgi:lincosamide nucleotidyltransferase A/C/D/E
MMTGHDVLRVLDALYVNGVSPVIEGGWGVDALLGRQNRTHLDVDLVITETEREATLGVLNALGYDHIVTLAPGRSAVNQPDGRTVDLHVTDAKLIQKTSEGPFQYPARTLDGRGLIVGRPVRCLTAEGQVLTHADHDLTEAGRGDLFLLADQVDARLAYPLARGIDMICRAAEVADIPAMATIMSDDRRVNPLRQIRGTHSLRPDFYWRYWHDRMVLPGTVALVITLGGAIAATVATSPWQKRDLPCATTAVLYGLATHPSVAVEHLDETLLQQAVTLAKQQGFSDIRTWVEEDDVANRRLFERSGWSPDGTRVEITPDLAKIRYAAR